MWLIVKLLLMILFPLAWGLGSDWVFAKIHSRFVGGGRGGDRSA